MGKKPSPKAAPPAVSFKEEVAGRDTMTAIAEDGRRVLRPPSIRSPATTKHYGDRISNAPGAVSPKVARAMDTSPDVSVSMQPAGRETYALIHEEHRAEIPDIEITADGDGELDDDEYLDTLEIEQVYTFVVQAPLEQFRSTEERFRLVERRLLTQMPGCSLDQVSKIEMEATPSSDGIVVKIWARIID